MKMTLTFAVCIIFNFYHVMSHRFGVHDKEHLQEHLQGTVNFDFDNMTEDELNFHYFNVHDVEGDNRLDGCELIQSVLHFYSEASTNFNIPTMLFSDIQLSSMVDRVLASDDKNQDGFLDYAEFVDGQLSKGFVEI